MNLPASISLPLYVPIVFGICVLFTLYQFHKIIRNSTYANMANKIVGFIILWCVAQSILSKVHFYGTNMMTTPPKFLLAFLPTLLVILAAFLTAKGKAFIKALPLKDITWLNVVRIPVELCLYWLFLAKAVPELMSFSGRNFDILAGLTAPLIVYFGFYKKLLSKAVILLWNFVSLGLLLFIIANGLLSAPTILQQFAFDQPNIALAYFPYVLLPALIVPVVLFGHFVSIYQLIKDKSVA